MAFKLPQYTNGAGVPIEYWKITDYSIRTLYKSVDITFSGWVNQSLSDKNYSPVETKKVRCIADGFDNYFATDILNGEDSNPLLQMYNFAKENSDFFKDAENI